jgi:hypothetical protein
MATKDSFNCEKALVVGEQTYLYRSLPDASIRSMS